MRVLALTPARLALGLGCCVAVLALTSPARATTYHVAPGGTDTADGSEAKPFKTFAKAVSMLTAGDTLLLRDGTYAEQLVLGVAGADGKEIVVSAYPGEAPVIDGQSVPLNDMSGLVEINGAAWVRVSGLKVQKAGPGENAAGILVTGSSHVVVEKNHTIDTTSSGIGVWKSDHVRVDGNEVELACNDGSQECITVAITDTFEVSNNHVHDGGPGTNGGEGIDTKDGASRGKVWGNHVHDLPRVGLYADAWNKHTFEIEIFANRVHHCSSGIDVATENGGFLENVSVHDNLVYENQNIGLWVAGWGVDGQTHAISGVEFLNNTVVANGAGTTWGGGFLAENPEASGVVVRNNLFSKNLSFGIGVAQGSQATVDHNLIDGFMGDPDEIKGTAAVEGDPLFVAASSHDYHLGAGSPAIDTGSPDSAPTADFDGNVRPAGAGVDIGAYEYGSSPAVDGGIGGGAGAGATGSGATGATGGTSSTGGAGGAGGNAAGAGAGADDGGCGCRVAGSRMNSVLALLGVIAVAACARRRRRSL